MHLLRKYDVARFTRNDAMFAQCAARHTSFAQRTSLGEAVIICRRQTSFKKRTFVYQDKGSFFVGGSEGNRTPVRKCVCAAFYERRLCVFIPLPTYHRQSDGLVASFLHPALKALSSSVPCDYDADCPARRRRGSTAAALSSYSDCIVISVYIYARTFNVISEPRLAYHASDHSRRKPVRPRLGVKSICLNIKIVNGIFCTILLYSTPQSAFAGSKRRLRDLLTASTRHPQSVTDAYYKADTPSCR